jgi:hypothetical protein
MSPKEPFQEVMQDLALRQQELQDLPSTIESTRSDVIVESIKALDQAKQALDWHVRATDGPDVVRHVISFVENSRDYLLEVSGPQERDPITRQNPITVANETLDGLHRHLLLTEHFAQTQHQRLEREMPQADKELDILLRRGNEMKMSVSEFIKEARDSLRRQL